MRRGAPLARAARGRGSGDPDLRRRHGPDRLARLPPRTRTADLKITYTAMGCPAMDFIEDDIRERAARRTRTSTRSTSRSSGTRSGPRAASAPTSRETMRRLGDRGMSRSTTPSGRSSRARRTRIRCTTSGPSPSPTRISRSSRRAPIYDEQPWIEMIIVPRSAIREAIGMTIRGMSRDRDDDRRSSARYADNKGGARPPVRRVGGERADGRSPRWRRRRWPRTSWATRARRTPCWPELGVERDERRRWTRPAPCRSSPPSCPTGRRSSRPTWSIDGILTTFVAERRATARSSRSPSARARSSRRRAPTRSTPRRGRSASAAPAATTASCCCSASTRRGDAGRALAGPRRRRRATGRPSRQGMVASAARHAVREQVRDWLDELLAAEGCTAASSAEPERLVGMGRGEAR